MRKNELKMCILFAISAAFFISCLLYNFEVNDLKNEADMVAEKRRDFILLSQSISRAFLDFGKNQKQLLRSSHDTDIKKGVLRILKKIKAKKVAVKIFENNKGMYNSSDVRLQFEVKSEQDVYNFLVNLRLKFNVIFDVIKISQDFVDMFRIEMKFRCVEFKNIDEDIRINPKNRYTSKKEAVGKIRIFSKDSGKPKHILRGIINSSKAFIDEEWKMMGDFVEDCEIIGISDNAVTIKTDDVRKEIKMGNLF